MRGRSAIRPTRSARTGETSGPFKPDADRSRSSQSQTAPSNITVNAVCPGFIETEMVAEMPDEVLSQIVSKIPQRRLGQTAEIARAVYFLVADGNYITGQQLNINGGLYM